MLPVEVWVVVWVVVWPAGTAMTYDASSSSSTCNGRSPISMSMSVYDQWEYVLR